MKHWMMKALVGLGMAALVACQSPVASMTKMTAAGPAARGLSAGFSGDVTLKAGANGKFIGVDAAQAGQLVANRDSAETFTLVPQAGGKYALKAKSTGLYVSADLNKAGALVADRPVAQGWEYFTLEAKGNDDYALKADSNGKYVCADLDKASKLAADRASAQGWEIFTIVATGGGGGGGGGGAGVTGTYSKKDDWGNGYNGQFTLTNTTSAAVSNWSVTFDAPALAAVYNANWTQVGSKVTLTPKAGTGGASIPAGGSVNDVIFTVYNSVVPPTNIVVTGGVVTKPAAPATLTAAPSNGAVTLSWTASSGAASYTVYWAVGASVTTASGTKVTGVSSPWTHTGLANGTTYSYLVTAVNSAGESGASPLASAIPQLTVPAAPVLGATAGNASVTVNLAAVSAGASTYNLYWSTSPLVTPATGTKVAGAAFPYTHGGRTNGTTYYYVATAQNAAGESPASPVVSATPTALFAWNNPSSGSFLHGTQTNGTVITQKAGAWDSIIPPQPGMKIVNNLWGIGAPFNNGSGEASIFSEDIQGTNAFGWAWNLNSMKPNSVITYQEIGWGWSPNSGEFFNGATPIHRISENKKYTVDFDLKRTGRGGAWNTAFDIWLYPETKPTGGSGGFKGGYEIMIWFDYEVQGPWGSNPQDVSINGRNWKVYDNDGSAGWRVISYLVQGGPVNSVRNYDVTAFINDAASRYSNGTGSSVGLSRNHYINAIEFGSESCGGQGMLEVANYKLTIQ